jgi:hypothetical protein
VDYEKAARYWAEKERQDVRMEDAALLAEMERFILAHNTCALAAGFEDFVRCTPIEYTYRNGQFWLLSEGGLKFQALAHNANVCLAIFDAYAGPEKLGGMQVSGRAELVEPWSSEYLELLAYKHLPAERLKKLPITMHLIRITPVRIDFLWSGFKAAGVSSRQHLCFPAED